MPALAAAIPLGDVGAVMHDVAIIGGGPAGAATAIHLARAGRRVLLLERSAAPRDVVCGEFLSGEALIELRHLGLDPVSLGALPITRLRLVDSSCALPFPAASLRRAVLDAALLDRAEAAGVLVRRGIAVRDPASLAARQVVLATGKQELRGAARPVPRGLRRWTGLQWHLPRPADLADEVRVQPVPDGYAGLQPVGTDQATLCIALRDASGDWRARLPAGLRALIGVAKPRAISGVPYGHRHAGLEDQLYRVGDQVAVIPSFCGDGIAIALHSARRAAAAILAGQDAREYHAALRTELATQFRAAAILSHLAGGPRRAAMLAATLRTWPGLLRHAARLTRIPDTQAGKSRIVAAVS